MNWWNKISTIGCQPGMEPDNARAQHLLNRIIFFGLAVSILSIPLILSMNSIVQTVTHLMVVLLTPFSWLLSKQRKVDSATIFLCTIMMINLVLQGLIQHQGSSHYLLLAIAVFPLVLMKKTKTPVLIFILAAICFVVVEEFHSYISLKTDYSAEQLQATHTGVVVVSFLTTFIMLFQTRLTNITYQAKVISQRQEIEEKHTEITDSINYSERIQRSFLASTDVLNKNLNDYFIFFQPKETVSGDFYWAGKLANNNFAMVNADSTGHGVPGAIMSILNITSIEKAVEENKLSNPASIFNATRKTIIERLKKDGSPEGGKDGMDASIICFDFDKNKFTYTAAQNPIWIIRDGELTEIKPEKMPIGKHDKDHIPFEGGEFEMQKGDQIYTLTDGFQDQFGGPKGKKFMIKKMREYVLSISHLPMQKQHQKLYEVFSSWKGDLEQVDDVCVIGVRI
ncbi:MAG: serine phosphatase RsbU (regulator of sigma subunit) [Patiriisocius sp.]|jgi:serine phosphatase RsbU (regulator of sigma subunit)